eukprot:TRINITY_DN16618_c0_g1_i1.p2 TRINITY_DN16618_c0_g1~~TRINITY_DN16618_c0_g1_i1.p2  ORF type:complete len:132 (-),score=46.56 TRINITY_DN16618_c0_g1_i1:123-518(-)
MIWNTQSRLLFKSLTNHTLIIRNVKNMLLDWASFEAGTLPKAEFVVEGRFDEDYFTEAREKQLGALLAQEVIDGEDVWVDYERDEVKVKIDLADMVLKHLVNETVEAVAEVEYKKTEKHFDVDSEYKEKYE